MPVVNLCPLINSNLLTDPDGNVLALGKIYTYQGGSTTPYSTYTDYSGTVAWPNPIILGTDGKVAGLIWLEQFIVYKFIITDINDRQLYVYDNFGGVVTSIPSVQAFPTGAIVMWSGSIGSIPLGWALCDGLAGRPDLRDKFIIGAGNNYAVGNQGGSKDSIVVQHSHSASIVDAGHMHTWTANRSSKGENATPYMLTDPNVGENFNGTATYQTSTSSANLSATINNAGQTGTNANLPPYYALCFIIKT